MLERGLVEVVLGQGAPRARRPGLGREPVELAVGEQALRERGEHDDTHPLLLDLVEQLLAASRVLAAEYDEMPAYSALPVRTAWSSAIIVSSTGVSGSNRWL